MKLSIVATLYQSAEYLQEFYKRCSTVAQQFAGDEYEIILVNDGSPDNSLDLAIKLVETDKHLRVIDLSRNFGHHKAIMTGLAHAKGELIYLLDSDLEEQPEWLLEFSELMDNDKSLDVVYGFQEQRKGGFFERVSGQSFYRLFKTLTNLPITKNIITARLMRSVYVQALLQHQERELFLAGLCHLTGFNQLPTKVIKLDTSQTTYTLRKKITLFVNSVTSFSSSPLIFIFYAGLFIFTLAMLYTGYLIINKIFLSSPLSGWTSVMASIWLLGGMIISAVGIIGIYLSKVYTETKRRPYSIIKRIYER